VTPSNLSGFTTIRFTATGQGVTLVFINSAWAIAGRNGVSLV